MLQHIARRRLSTAPPLFHVLSVPIKYLRTFALVTPCRSTHKPHHRRPGGLRIPENKSRKRWVYRIEFFMFFKCAIISFGSRKHTHVNITATILEIPCTYTSPHTYIPQNRSHFWWEFRVCDHILWRSAPNHVPGHRRVIRPRTLEIQPLFCRQRNVLPIAVVFKRTHKHSGGLI